MYVEESGIGGGRNERSLKAWWGRNIRGISDSEAYPVGDGGDAARRERKERKERKGRWRRGSVIKSCAGKILAVLVLPLVCPVYMYHHYFDERDRYAWGTVNEHKLFTQRRKDMKRRQRDRRRRKRDEKRQEKKRRKEAEPLFGDRVVHVGLKTSSVLCYPCWWGFFVYVAERDFLGGRNERSLVGRWKGRRKRKENEKTFVGRWKWY